MSNRKLFDDFLDSCPNCSAMWGVDEIQLGRCFACGYTEGDNPVFEEDDIDEIELERLESAAFGGHKDVWIEVGGHQQRILGDPNMSEETKKALVHLIEAAKNAAARGDFDKDDQ